VSAQAEPAGGDPLVAVYRVALPQVYGYLLPRCGSVAVAEDLTAETFMAAVAAGRQASPPAVTVGWLVGIARHKLVDHWRAAEREQRGLRAVEAVADSGPDPTDDPWDARLDVLLARQVLDAQTGIHRAALSLRYLDGLPVPDVARVLGRTVAATEALLVRARAAFRRTYTAIEEGSPR
jgi:RNA polymerase sigma-70 factor, ECF subfamily